MHWTRTRSVTYFAARAQVTSLLAGTKATGLRVTLVQWVDDATPANGSHPAGTITLDLLRGDGRTPNFHRYASRVLPPGTTVDEAQRVAGRMLTDHESSA